MSVPHIEKLTITTSGATGTGTIKERVYGLLQQLIVSPATSTTTYELTITNGQGLTIYKTIGRVGAMSPILNIPLIYGVGSNLNTITISNASADEAFTVQVIVDKTID